MAKRPPITFQNYVDIGSAVSEYVQSPTSDSHLLISCIILSICVAFIACLCACCLCYVCAPIVYARQRVNRLSSRNKKEKETNVSGHMMMHHTVCSNSTVLSDFSSPTLSPEQTPMPTSAGATQRPLTLAQNAPAPSSSIQLQALRDDDEPIDEEIEEGFDVDDDEANERAAKEEPLYLGQLSATSQWSQLNRNDTGRKGSNVANLARSEGKRRMLSTTGTILEKQLSESSTFTL